MSNMIEYKRLSFKHEEGKAYEIYSLFNGNTGTGVVVRRWGKAEALKRIGGGEIKVEKFGSRPIQRAHVASIEKQRLRRGYQVDDDEIGSLEADTVVDNLIINLFSESDTMRIVSDLDIGRSSASEQEVVEEGHEASIVFKHEPVRGADWASW